MPLFALICFDRPNALDLRIATREAHLAYVGQHRAMLKVAGPMLDEAGGMAGSMFILEAPDRAAVEAFTAADPYSLAGLFGQVEIRGYRASIGSI
jgi:uncharacterized protein YciI